MRAVTVTRQLKVIKVEYTASNVMRSPYRSSMYVRDIRKLIKCRPSDHPLRVLITYCCLAVFPPLLRSALILRITTFMKHNIYQARE